MRQSLRRNQRRKILTMRKLKRWLPEMACILLIALTVWILQSPERTETARVWMHRAMSLVR